MNVMLLNEDRLFPSESSALKVARSLYAHIRSLPIVSPHGHTQAAWFATNEPFPDPATLFVQPDHYVFRMLYSQGVSMDDLGIGQPVVKDPRRVWHIFASHYYLFRGTPTRIWLDYAFQELFGMKERLSEKTADLYFDTIAEKLNTPEFLPRALTKNSTSKCCRRRSRRSIHCRRTKRSAIRAGRRGLFRRSGRMRWSIRRSRDLPGSWPNWASKTGKIPRPGKAT
jgi:glucuronate isomerase